MKLSPKLEDYRLREGYYGSKTGDPEGAFFMPGPCGQPLMIIASDGVDPIAEGWEHVSVSLDRRIPNWIEMSFVKKLFWADDECVVQFHPPKSSYINVHPNCLHLWRHRSLAFPQPPTNLIA